MTIQEFIQERKINMTASRAAGNPNMDKDGWAASASHWLCVFTLPDCTFQTFFSQGSAHKEAPTAADVLDCLASDAAGFENTSSFEEWAEEYGYNPDSRKSERTYRHIGRQSDDLKSFLGADSYKALLWETDRL